MKFGKNEIIGLVLVVLVIAGAAWFVSMRLSEEAERNSEASKALVGSEAQVANYTDLDGNPVSLNEYNGRVRVVNAWATWCPFCINELPVFEQVASEYDQTKVVFIAINRKEAKERAKAFVEQQNVGQEIIFVQDPNDVFYRSIGGFSMPETIFYDADGNVSFHKRGPMGEAEIRQHIETALTATNN